MRNDKVPSQPSRRCQNGEQVSRCVQEDVVALKQNREKIHFRLGNNSLKVLQFLFQNVLIRRPRTDNNACLKPCADFLTHFTRMMFLLHLQTILIV